jgi:predicted acetyltransferase
MPSISIDPLDASDRDALLALDQSAFGFDDRDIDSAADTAWIEWDRVFGARRDGALAGVYVVYTFGLAVPGSPPQPATTIPMAALTWVSVHPDHRRRGVLTEMIGHHLATVHDGGRGEAISGLFASESRIYGRYGYGVATEARRLVIDAKARLRPLRDPGNVITRFEPVDPDVHAKVVKQVYDAVCLQRPGHTVRPPAHGQRHLADPPSRRPGGAESLKILVGERDGQPTGYALVRRTTSWEGLTPQGKVAVTDFHAVDPQTAHALWRRVLDFDLMAEVTTPWVAYDDPLLLWAQEADPQPKSAVSLWIRIVDIASALTARGYARELEVVLEVSDEQCPWNAGRWRIAAGPDGASCERTTRSADVSLDIRELGATFLGDVTFESLGRAAIVDERTPGALAACSAAFRASVLPATPYMF